MSEILERLSLGVSTATYDILQSFKKTLRSVDNTALLHNPALMQELLVRNNFPVIQVSIQ